MSFQEVIQVIKGLGAITIFCVGGFGFADWQQMGINIEKEKKKLKQIDEWLYEAKAKGNDITTLEKTRKKQEAFIEKCKKQRLILAMFVFPCAIITLDFIIKGR